MLQKQEKVSPASYIFKHFKAHKYSYFQAFKYSWEKTYLHSPYVFTGFEPLAGSGRQFAECGHGGFPVGLEGTAMVTAVLVRAALAVADLLVADLTALSKDKA